MGFRGFSEVQKHFGEFIYKKGPRKHTAETQARLDYGTEHKIHRFGTVASVFMPALLPACATLFEVGSYAKHGDIIRNLLIDSPDGLVSMEHSASSTQCCHPDIFRYYGDEMISLELKSPYTDPLKLTVQYKCDASKNCRRSPPAETHR